MVFAIVANVVILAVTYVVVSYGLFPLMRWSAARFFQELGGLMDLLGKTLPLLLLFSAFLVLNAEMWQVAHDLPGPYFAMVVALLVLLGTTFIAVSARTAVRVHHHHSAASTAPCAPGRAGQSGCVSGTAPA